MYINLTDFVEYVGFIGTSIGLIDNILRSDLCRNIVDYVEGSIDNPLRIPNCTFIS